MVAIPDNFLPNTPEMRLIALYGVDSYGARDEEGLTVLTWCSVFVYLQWLSVKYPTSYNKHYNNFVRPFALI